MELTDDQKGALTEFNEFLVNPSERTMMIKGYAGTGKTSLILHIINNINNQKKLYDLLMGQKSSEIDVLVTATTNKAARVLGTLTHREPLTVYSLLGLRVVNNYQTGEQSLQKTKDYQVQRNAVLVIDEASFVDDLLLKMIDLSTVNCKVLYVLDPDQLVRGETSTCPVDKLAVRTVTLNKIVRTPETNTITQVAADYRSAVHGNAFPIRSMQTNTSDVQLLPREDFVPLMLETFQNQTSIDECKILAWTNTKVREYNNYIRHSLGQAPTLEVAESIVTNKPIIEHGIATDTILRITKIGQDRQKQNIWGNTITLNNSFDVFTPKKYRDAENLMKHYAKHQNWHQYFDIKDNWADLRPLHACTVHKSQGSTYQTHFIDLNDIGKCLVASNVARMLYVAVSRGADKVYLTGRLPWRYGGN